MNRVPLSTRPASSSTTSPWSPSPPAASRAHAPRDYEALFDPQFNYSAADIAAKTGIPLGEVQAAAQRREISSVCTVARDGASKIWKGHKIIAWLKFRDSKQAAGPAAPQSIPTNPSEPT
jgi:hypothetical protein